MGQPCAKALLNFCLHGLGGLGTPQSTPHLSSCVYTSLDTSSGGVCDSESPIMFLLVWLGFACQGVNPPFIWEPHVQKGPMEELGLLASPGVSPHHCATGRQVCPEPGGSAPWAAALGAKPVPPGHCQGRG